MKWSVAIVTGNYFCSWSFNTADQFGAFMRCVDTQRDCTSGLLYSLRSGGMDDVCRRKALLTEEINHDGLTHWVNVPQNSNQSNVDPTVARLALHGRGQGIWWRSPQLPICVFIYSVTTVTATRSESLYTCILWKIIIKSRICRAHLLLSLPVSHLATSRLITYRPNYPRRLCRSAWVKRSSPAVCSFVCPQHNSKTNDPKVFKLGIGNDSGYPVSIMV